MGDDAREARRESTETTTRMQSEGRARDNGEQVVVSTGWWQEADQRQVEQIAWIASFDRGRKGQAVSAGGRGYGQKRTAEYEKYAMKE